jgi:hypothetical protein
VHGLRDQRLEARAEERAVAGHSDGELGAGQELLDGDAEQRRGQRWVGEVVLSAVR